MKKNLFLLLIIGLLVSCGSNEDKAKDVVEKYFEALSENDTKTAYELYPNSNPQNYGIFIKLKDNAYKNPKIVAVKTKGNKYEVDFMPASCLYVEQNSDGDFVITDSRNLFDTNKDELNSKYNIAAATGAINGASTDIQVIKAENLLTERSDYFKFLTKKYAKYYGGDFKVLSVKKNKLGHLMDINITYQTSVNAPEHAVVVDGKDKSGKVIATKEKRVDWLDQGHVNSVSVFFNGGVVDMIVDYDVNIGLIENSDPMYRLETCGAPFSPKDYKEFQKSQK